MAEVRSYFFHEHNLPEVIKKCPECAQLYLSLIQENERLVLRLSKNQGQMLYFVSNQNHENLDLYKKEIEECLLPTKPRIVHEQSIVETSLDQPTEDPKRSKQKSLFSFIKKQ